MANEVSLSSGMRSNLLQLQKVETQIGQKQNTLATGNKINTALDGPTSFFAAKSLNQRAGDLTSLKDSMGQSISTIQAADKGITAINDLIEQAKGLTTAAFASLDMDEGSIATRASLAKQFDSIKSQIDKLAGDSGYAGKNLIGGNGLSISSTSASRTAVNSITGVDNARVTNVVKADTYSINISGTGKIIGNAEDLTKTEEAHGLVGLEIKGNMSSTDGNFGDVSIEVAGAKGRLRTFTVTDGNESRTTTYFDNTQAASAKTTAAATSGAPQTSEVTFEGTIEAGDTFTVTINNTKFSYEVTEDDITTANTSGGMNLSTRVATALSDSIGARRTSDAAFGLQVADAEVSDGKLLVTGTSDHTDRKEPFTISATAENALTKRISETFASGATVSFTVNRNDLDNAENYGIGKSNIEKNIDITVEVSNLQGQTVTRSGNNERGDSKLSNGEASFGFDSGTVRINVDQKEIMQAASNQKSANLVTNQVSNANTQNDVRVQFNEKNTNAINVTATNLTTSGQGMQIDGAQNGWMDRSDIESSVKQLDYATGHLRSASQQLSTNLNVITTRENFTKEFSDVLKDGAGKLTLADQNEEGASLLMLQTRQQLGTIALSLANQSQQSILRLF